ncbi:flavodoxin family protein [Methanoplanus endosymbiosus]|uniref:Flavodoxin family protein n=1 Tax=Methanoplanus endosymbiosus TaxID=33865 RepID=A0A9E7PRL8_9EURY|nr:flavodoxin family protein [Methanoplanus endosymbiosus]UUX93801.1 flavodoxin family protein [Methanoplanus endosymbiosus]
MKVVMFNGSPRKKGNTGILLKEVEKTLNDEGIETEIVQIAGKKFHGCTACMKCFENQDCKCVFDDDFINNCIEKMADADGIIIGSPTYFADVSAETKALIDRAGFVGTANGGLFRRKAGAAVVAVRRAGAVHAYDTINHFFGISSMFTVGSSYWNLGIGLDEGDVLKDEEGLLTMQELGKNMAWLLRKINSDGKEEEEEEII